MITKRFLLAALLVTGISGRTLYAASLATETFTDTNGGWQGLTNSPMVLTNLTSGGNPGGYLRGSFSAIGIPTPDAGAFVVTGRLASANFIGDYMGVEAHLLGFDFRANEVVPGVNGLRINIFSGTKFMVRRLNAIVTATGVWYRIRLPLLAPELGGWEENDLPFSSIMTNVTRLEIEITRNGTGAQTYLLDNFFLDRLPAASALLPITNGMVVTWMHLRSGETYRMDAATSLIPPNWTSVTSLVATASVFQATHETAQPAQSYRMVLE